MTITQRASRYVCTKKFAKSAQESRQHAVSQRQMSRVLPLWMWTSQRRPREAYQAVLLHRTISRRSLMEVPFAKFHSVSSRQKRNITEMYLTKEKFTVDVKDQSQEVPGEKGARQSKITPPGIVQQYVFDDAKTLAETIRRGHKVSDNGPCLGWRDSDSEYKWLNYAEVIERSENISYGMVQIGMKPGQESFIGIFAPNCVEWVLMEYACYNQSAVVVPLYDTFGPAASTYILNHIEAEFVLCDTEKKVWSLLKVKDDIPNLRHIMVIEEVSKEVQKLATQKHVSVHRLKDIEELGKQNPKSLLLPQPSDLATISYTSGTTGQPKGVTLTHRNMVTEACGMITQMGIDFVGPGDKLISYLPMAHMLDRLSQIIFYLMGGSVGFFRGDVKLLMEDIHALKPTMMPTVPRILNKIYDKVQSEVKESPFKKFLLNTALRAKKLEIERGIIRNTSLWDRLVLKKIQNIFGGQMRLLVSAGAPVRHEVISLFRYGLGCLVVEAYGQTESTAACNVTVIGDTTEGAVGPPLPCSFVKLVDVPEMGYFAKNNEGEILIKGPTVTKGYFKDPEKTAEILDEDGWLRSGDIGKWLSNGSLTVIDRKKNLLKLAQGEYISSEKIESVYLCCPFVEQIYVHGGPLENCLVAIVFPQKEALMSWCEQEGISGEWKDICENEVVKRHILKEMSRVGRENGLKGFEEVKSVYLSPEGFTMENNLLTVTLKIKRKEVQQTFKDVIRKMYDDLHKEDISKTYSKESNATV